MCLMCHMQTLNLWGNKIGDAGCKALAKAAAGGALPLLEELHLEGNKIGDEGMIKLSEACADGAMAAISIIDLDGNKASEAGKKAMRDVAKSRGFRVDLA